MTLDMNTILEYAGAITAIGGAYHTIQRILANYKRKKEEYRQQILNQAKNEVDKAVNNLEFKIKQVEDELAWQKESVARDLSVMKDAYNADIRVLGQKIEELRQDLITQHSQLVGLLTKLVDTR